MDQAKADKKTSLYHGLAKAVSSTKTPEFEDQAKKFLTSSDIGISTLRSGFGDPERYSSARDLIEPLSNDANTTLARKARQALGR
jgi:hypothetical protein